jgi:diguanylate cyclase (GGDEF)-like protein
VGHVKLSATELLLLMTALQMALFAIGWAVAMFTLDSDRTTLRSFFACNTLLGIALAMIATREKNPAGFSETFPDLLILMAVLILIYGVHAFWSMRMPSHSLIAIPVVSAAAIIFFGMVMRHDGGRVFSLIAGFIWLVTVAMWRSYEPTRREFGAIASDALTIAVLMVSATVAWRAYLAAFTNEAVNLNEASTGSEIGVFVLSLASTAPNMLYAYFVGYRLLRRANEAARSDGLTGLLNHRAFMEEADRRWTERRAKKVIGAVLAVDLDHFKRVNDEFGHNAGDEVLRSFAIILRSTCGERNVVGRTGGEEFLVIHSPATRESSKVLAERLMRRVARARWAGARGSEIKLTVSIGIAFDLPTDLRPNDLLLRADLALYTAKEEGRNRVVYA